MAVGEAD